MDMYERFKVLCNIKNVTIKNACDEIGIAPSTVSTWRTRNNLPTGEMAIKIAHYFDTTTDFVLGEINEDNEVAELKPLVTPSEAELIKMYRIADEEEKRMIIEMLAFFKSKKQD